MISIVSLMIPQNINAIIDTVRKLNKTTIISQTGDPDVTLSELKTHLKHPSCY